MMSSKKLGDGPAAGLRQVRRDRCGVDVPEIDVHAGAGLQQVDRDEPENKRDRGQHLEIDERLERDPPDPGHVGHAGDAVHDRAKDDGRDQHADRLDEGVAEGPHPHACIRVEVAERDAGDHGQKHQEPELQIERPGRSAAPLLDGSGWCEAVHRGSGGRYGSHRPAPMRSPPDIVRCGGNRQPSRQRRISW